MTNRDVNINGSGKSHLFIFRVWREQTGNHQPAWLGRIQHVNSGEVRYFRDLANLQKVMDELLGGIEHTEKSGQEDTIKEK